MEKQHTITHQALARVYQTEDTARLAHFLLKEQLNEWELAGKNYEGLANVVIRRFNFSEFNLFVQFNPERIRSSAAKTDKKSIEARPCFLCRKNLPNQQKGLLFNDSYLILVNPFPIFQEHFTIPHLEHKPQRIKGNFQPMLELSKAMHHYVVFYNGPRCGASAPDHFHFQAGIKGFMPIDYEYPWLKSRFDTIFETEEIGIYGMQQYGRHFIALEGNAPEMLTTAFEKLYAKLEEWPHEEEPMMNILAGYWEDRWRIQVFPRRRHRPDFYYHEGEDNLLVSPASVDLGGTLITPQKKDFDKISKSDIVEMFRQVSINDDDYAHLIDALKGIYGQAFGK